MARQTLKRLPLLVVTVVFQRGKSGQRSAMPIAWAPLWAPAEFESNWASNSSWNIRIATAASLMPLFCFLVPLHGSVVWAFSSSILLALYPFSFCKVHAFTSFNVFGKSYVFFPVFTFLYFSYDFSYDFSYFILSPHVFSLYSFLCFFFPHFVLSLSLLCLEPAPLQSALWTRCKEFSTSLEREPF